MNLYNFRHTPEGQETLSKLLAAKYVHRGALWLNRHAPKGWFRNCRNGASSRIYTNSTCEGVLGFAFEYVSDYADNAGEINTGKVLRHFKLVQYSPQTYRYGFQCSTFGYKPFRRLYPQISITYALLDDAWAELLKDPPGVQWQSPYRHRTSLDWRLEHMVFDDPTPVGDRSSFWRRIKGVFGNHRRILAS